MSAPTLAHQDVAGACSAGLRFLVRRQSVDGYWSDFALPVGQSDGWVTAYVTASLAQVAVPTEGDLDLLVRSAAHHGAQWLSLRRRYAPGWGFNEHTGADAGSTGWAIRAIRATGGGIEPADRDFLMAHWDSSGGVRTYLGNLDGWSEPHPEATAVAVLALASSHPAKVRDALAYSRDIRSPDGSWPAYWWATTHFSTMLHVEMRRALGILDGTEGPVVSDRPQHRVQAAFDLACTLATAALSAAPESSTAGLAQRLAAQQLDDGSWPAAPILRLTDPESGRHGRPLKGALYADQNRVFTTATAVRALALSLAFRRS